jgi:pyrroloquinoline quinone biosynthesis protein B
MKVVVLGSGIASGLPAWNDGSPRALRARAGDPAVPRRRGLALAVSADDRRYSLIEAPLHLSATLTRDPRFQPTPQTRSVPLDTLVLTCAELDACAGALAFARGLSLRIASTHGVREALVDHDAGFRALEPGWAGQAFDRPFLLDREEQLEARFFPLPGPVPGPLREHAPKAGRARAGLRITDRRTGTRLVFAPRIAQYDSATLAELRAADLRLVDGTCLNDDEGRQIHPGVASARDLGHLPIDGREGSLVWLSGMRGRSVYVHLAASNPACETSSKEWTRIHEAGVLVAHDGMELEL